MMHPADARWSAGFVAAAGLAAAKQLPSRGPLSAALPSRFRPTDIRDLSIAFSTSDPSAAARVARLSSAALVYSVDKTTSAHCRGMLGEDERALLQELHEGRRPHESTDRSCPHCDLLLGAMYRSVPPVVVLRHSAHVKVTFDPETNVAEGRIDSFQVAVPTAIVDPLLHLAHPLHWSDAEGSLIQRTDPVTRDGRPATFQASDAAGMQYEWEEGAARGEAFIFEVTDLPINASIRATAENIIQIRNFEKSSDKAIRSLGYDYSLERCVRSNFGIAWEPSGLDIDDGIFRATAIPLKDVDVQALDTSSDQRLSGLKLGWLTRRDVETWKASCAIDEARRERARRQLREGWEYRPTARATRTSPVPALDRLKPNEIGSALRFLERQLEKAHGDLGPFSILDVTASKRLHFTVPENGPIELWHLLTQSAPSFLFAFLNQAVCLAPHVLMANRTSQGATAS